MSLIPPKQEAILTAGRFRLRDKEPKETLSLPIDHFFRSLAQEAGEESIAVVLSGSGSDGSRGVREISAAGGLVIVESADSAKFNGMPSSSIATTEFGIDFSHYKATTVTRRVKRRMTMQRIESIDVYAESLVENREELGALYHDLLIGVTRFFRDTEAFKKLELEVIPEIVEQAGNEEIRVWVPGCATGEEAYSVAILFHEQMRKVNRAPHIKIFATDVHRASLNFAGSEAYPASTLECVSNSRVSNYFTPSGDGYTPNAELRKSIVFAEHNLLRDAPFTKLDLIVCRNLLIYFQPPSQKKVISLFHFGLKTGGHMLLGPSESTGGLAEEFNVVDEHWKIYKKRRDIRLPADVEYPVGTINRNRSRPGAQLQQTARGAPPIDPGMIGAYDYWRL